MPVAIGSLLSFLAFLAIVVLGIMGLVYVAKPLVRAIGWVFRAIFWTIAHVFEFVGGMIGDSFRFLSTIPAMLVLSLLALGSVALGRWSAAAHFGRSIRREFVTAGTCLYGVALRRPLKFVWMHGLLEGIEKRVPEAMAAAPGRDRPGRTGQFEGYTIVGSLPSGGSGAKLHVAEPSPETRRRIAGLPSTVVIKSFGLEEGSALPQIVRESRALESAKRLGAVFEHGMDEQRFWYVMPYHRGEHLGIVTRQLHAESGTGGLEGRRLTEAVGHVTQLAETLLAYHREGLWHKDVKPENVIVAADGAHLVDLGLVTPLHSAMTLTTHGTEYFRDPELVRQALRGVKVHQVDGTKFDIFGLGAVLYFVVENDFPAHGPLSRFSKRSPDAVKWIIRRAMADYQHRYDSTADLLADLRVVHAAADPFAVRPADLPSVRGRGLEEQDADIEADVIVMPVAAAAPAAAAAESPAESPAPGRPRLERTGFFSSRYTVAEQAEHAVDGSLRDVDRMLDEITGAAAATGAEARRRARAVRDASLRRAREAREARRARRTACGWSSSRSGWRGGPREGLAVAMVLAMLGASAVVWLSLRDSDSGRPRPIVQLEQRLGAAPAPAGAVVGVFPTDRLGPSELVERTLARREAEGYRLIELPDAAVRAWAERVRRWEAGGRSPDAGQSLEDLLEELGLYGVLELRVSEEGGIEDRLVHSSRLDAAERTASFEPRSPRATRLAERFDRPEGMVLLVNDHPRHLSLEIADRIGRAVTELEAAGWTITRDPEVEADLRTVLPIRTDAADVPMTPVLADRLQRHGLAGVLRVIGVPGDEQDLTLQLVRPERTQAVTVPVHEGRAVPPSPPAPPAPPTPPTPPSPSHESMAAEAGGGSRNAA
ncbi:MAG: protein kinase domain-containing protein [Planctomycetota bacterium]|jgi:serine/threonine protein kinase